ncbi:hypothetical protein COCCADRAFT_104488, partial [Bipolaris zeicola 26-R-13]
PTARSQLAVWYVTKTWVCGPLGSPASPNVTISHVLVAWPSTDFQADQQTSAESLACSPPIHTPPQFLLT